MLLGFQEQDLRFLRLALNCFVLGVRCMVSVSPYIISSPFKINEMFWTEAEEGIQALAEAAGAVPPAVLPEEDAIAAPDEDVFMWHIPEQLPEFVQADTPPLTNGVAMDYEGELSALLEAAWVKFDTPPPSPEPPV